MNNKPDFTNTIEEWSNYFGPKSFLPIRSFDCLGEQ